MDKGRVAALDAGRALAIVGVVAVHLSFQFPNLPHAVTLVARMVPSMFCSMCYFCMRCRRRRSTTSCRVDGR